VIGHEYTGIIYPWCPRWGKKACYLPLTGTVGQIFHRDDDSIHVENVSIIRGD